jgi:DNA-binding beta-propeller fold protein YncE
MGTVVSADGKELYVSTGRGSAIAIIDTQKNELAATVPVGNRVRGIALNPAGSNLYIANGASNDVSVIDVNCAKNCVASKSVTALGALRLPPSSDNVARGPPSTTRRRNSDNVRAARARGGLLPRCYPLAEKPPRLYPTRAE